MAELKVTLEGDASGLTKALDKATASVAKWSNQVDKDTKDATKAFAQIATNVTNSIDRASRALSRGFGKGIISRGLYTDLRLLDNNLQKISLGADQATNSLKGIGSAAPSITRTGTAVTGLARTQGSLQKANRKSSAGLLEFSRLVGDAPYGIRGMANNIQQMAFVMGAGGPLILAITVATAALDYFFGGNRRAKKEVDEFANSVKEASERLTGFARASNESRDAARTETIELRALWNAANDVTRSTKDRTAAIDALQRMFPDYFGDLTNEEVLARKGAAAYDALTKSIIASATARVAQGELDTAVGQIRANNALIDQEQARLDNINQRIKSERAAQDLARKAAKAGSEIGAGEVAAREQRINKLISERAKIQKPITQAQLENIRLNGDILKLEKEITNQTIAKSKAEAGYVKEKTKAVKAAKNERKVIKDIVADSLKINPLLSEGLADAAKSFDKDLAKAIANVAARASEQFKDIFEAAQLGPSGLTVQPNLRGPKGSIIKPDTEEVNNVWEQLAEDMRSNMSGSIQSLGSELTTVFRELELTGRSAFTNIMDGLRVTLNAALQNTVQSIASSIGSKVGADVGASVGKSVSKSLGDTVGGILGPGLGTLVGGVITGIGSLIGGLFGRGKRRREAEKQAEIQRKQLEEQKRMAKELERQSALAYTSSIIGKMLPGFGSVSNIDINSMGELTARVDGKDLLFVLGRAEGAKKRGV